MLRTRPLALLIATAALALGVTGCGSDDSSDGSSDKPVVVHITEKGGKIDPVGEVVKVSTGQQIDLVVTSDATDQIHVHSEPEHEFHVKAGDEDKKFSFSVETPGTIEVESHGLEVTILKLEVS
jgi:hypothetical protein